MTEAQDNRDIAQAGLTVTGGICLGLLIGAAVGILIDDLAMGVGIGVAVGAAVGAVWLALSDEANYPDPTQSTSTDDKDGQPK